MAGLIGGSSALKLRVKEFRSSGTFNVPSGVKTVGLFMVGGGAGSGAGNGEVGQGGNVVEINYDVDGKASCAVVIGAGGAIGAAGGDTSFDGVAIATGGQPAMISASQVTTYHPGHEGGTKGFGGHGAILGKMTASNGAKQGGPGANTGAGANGNVQGGSGYLRVEWYE